MESPIKYARSGDVHIAYRIFGDGPRDIVLIPGTISHVELLWELPSNHHLLKRLTAFARVIVFDKRGQGLSDRVAEQTLEERVGDVRAVMDASRFRARDDLRLVGRWRDVPDVCSHPSDSNLRPGAIWLFCVDQERTLDGHPRVFEKSIARLVTHWGEGIMLRLNAPSRRDDTAFLNWFARVERAAASPGSIRALMSANYDIDVRHLLAAIRVPTLILHRSGDKLVPAAAGRYLSENIPEAKYVELQGSDHLVLDQETQDIIVDQIEEFITGARGHLDEPDRMLATIMFTDIARSTERAVKMGDARWRELLVEYYAVLRKELTAFRGREINTVGDGALVTFDGPARAIRCARSLRENLRRLGLEVRAGLHTGECELISGDIAGIAVHIAARGRRDRETGRSAGIQHGQGPKQRFFE
jgi:pimeloyl-ACP methyl ester carboxylesterase